jgi:hypothetical protein
MTERGPLGRFHRATSGLGTTGERLICDRPRRQVRALAWVVPHRSGQHELHLRLTGLRRSASVGPFAETESMSFQGLEAEELFRYLAEQRQVAGFNTSTDYVTVRLDQSIPDPTVVARLLSYFERDPRLFTKVAEQIDAGQAEALLYAGSLVRIRNAVRELGDLVAANPVEHVFQKWFEERPWVFGTEYVERVPLRSIGLDAQADVLLRTADGFVEVFEIKRPMASVLVYDAARDVWRPSADLAAAFGQSLKYLDHLSEQQLILQTRHGVSAYQPRVRVVLGRSDAWSDSQHRVLRTINTHWHGVEVLTYDMVLARARTLLSHLVRELGRPESSSPSADS